MNDLIIYRKINEVGEIEIPFVFRQKLGIEENKKSWLKLEFDKDSIKITKK